MKSITESMINIITSKKGGTESTIAAAEVIIMDAKYNHWFAHVAKKRFSAEELFEILDPELLRQCEAFASTFDTNGNVSALVEALHTVSAELQRKMALAE
jgi:hypothetical protein